MSDPITAILGYLARCTVVGLVAMLVVALLERRSGPESAAMAAHAGLVSLLLTAVLAFLPWPTAWSVPCQWQAPADRPGIARETLPAPIPRRPSIEPIRPAPLVDRPRLVSGPTKDRPVPRPTRSPVPTVQRSAKPSIAPVVPEGSRVSRSFTIDPGWLSIALVVGWVLGFARFALGFIGLRRCLARSRPIEDANLEAIADEVRAGFGRLKRVALRESDAVGLPATVGWIAPCILLPRGWRGWTEVELRVVLTHEMAHICRGDFARRVAGQCCLIVHFYHPSAHWLASRLKLQQELAADAWGIRLAGGREVYLTTLARMALRHDESRAGRPTRSLLAFDGFFLRRMNMLCNGKPLELAPGSSPWRTRLITFGLLGLVVLMVSALRAPLAPAASRDDPPAASPTTPSARGNETPFDLSFVPDDAVGIVAIRPASLLALEEAQSFLTMGRLTSFEMKEGLAKLKGMGLSPDSIDQILYIQLKFDITAMKDETEILNRGAIIVKSQTPIDAKALAAALKAVEATAKFVIELPDPRTAIIGEVAMVKAMAARKQGSTPKLAWSDAWSGVERNQVALAFDATYAHGMTDLLLMGEGPLELMLITSPLAPIWDDARGISLGMSVVGDRLQLVSVNTAKTVPAAENTLQTIQALLTLSRNAASSIKRPLRKVMLNGNGGEVFLIGKLADLWAAQILGKIQVERTGSSVRFSSELDPEILMLLPQLAEML